MAPLPQGRRSPVQFHQRFYAREKTTPPPNASCDASGQPHAPGRAPAGRRMLERAPEGPAQGVTPACASRACWSAYLAIFERHLDARALGHKTRSHRDARGSPARKAKFGKAGRATSRAQSTGSAQREAFERVEKSRRKETAHEPRATTPTSSPRRPARGPRLTGRRRARRGAGSEVGEVDVWDWIGSRKRNDVSFETREGSGERFFSRSFRSCEL